MKILIADDDRTSLELLRHAVTGWGYEAVLATDGTEAWRALTCPGAPKLAVIDWIMSGMEGTEVIRRMREAGDPLPPYLILLTAQDSQKHIVEGLRSGANDYLTKPVHMAELRARLEVGTRVLELQNSLAERIVQLQSALDARERTEQKNAHLLAAMAQASDGVVITDARGTIEYVNAAFSRITGYTREEVTGRSTRVLKSGFHGEDFYRDLWKTITSGSVWNGELVNQRADGTLYTEQMSISPIRDSSGQVTNFIAIKKDLTAQKAAESELASERDFIRMLMDHVPDSIYLKDRESRFVRINNALAARLGLNDPSEAIGKTNGEFFLPGCARDTNDDEQRILETGTPLICKEERQLWQDGTVTWVSSTKMPLHGASGEIVGTFGISRDITQRKLVEQSLRESEQRYRFQSSLLRGIYDVSPDGILVVDRNGTVLSHNNKFLEVWGMEPADHVGGEDAALLASAATRVKHRAEFERRTKELYDDPSAADQTEIELQDGRTLDRISTALRGADDEYLGRVWFFRDVTERKRAEEAKTFLASIVQSSDDAIFGTVEGLIMSWNRGAEAMFGYTEPDVKGRHVSMLSPERRGETGRVLEKLAQGEAVANLETVGVRKDGSRFDVSFTISPVPNASGNAISAATSARDITARRRAEEAQAEETRLALLRAEVGAALTRTGSLRSGLQECSEAVVRRTGVAFARIWTLETAANVLRLEASAGIYTHIDGSHSQVPVGQFKIGRIAEHRRPYLSNDVQRDPEVGDHQWAKREGLVSFVGYPLLVGDEVVGVAAAFACRPLGDPALLAFASVANQLAQFIHAKRVEDAMLSSERRARLLFHAIPHPAYVFALDTLAFLEVNDRAVQDYGYSREDFARMTILDLRPPGDVQEVKEYFRTQPDRSYAGAGQQRKKDGSLIDVEITYHQIDYAGRRAGITVAQDISRRKKLEVDLRHAQKLESVGLLASGIAHEINTPIQFVGDNLRFLTDAFGDIEKLLAKSVALSVATPDRAPQAPGKDLQELIADVDWEYLAAEIPKALSQSIDGVGRVAAIVKAMKEFAHPDQNHKMPADLNHALASTMMVAHNELKYVASVETDFGEIPPVECHLGDLNQVFLNLLVNAAHAIGDVVRGTPSKGVIRVRTRREGDWVKISIGDTGCGIPEEIRGKIFDPFFTTKEVGRGTGQGLAISHSIVTDKHGGTLTFESEVGVGSTFCIALPATREMK